MNIDVTLVVEWDCSTQQCMVLKFCTITQLSVHITNYLYCLLIADCSNHS